MLALLCAALLRFNTPAAANIQTVQEHLHTAANHTLELYQDQNGHGPAMHTVQVVSALLLPGVDRLTGDRVYGEGTKQAFEHFLTTVCEHMRNPYRDADAITMYVHTFDVDGEPVEVDLQKKETKEIVRSLLEYTRYDAVVITLRDDLDNGGVLTTLVTIGRKK